MDDKITIDRSTFKALSADTRIEILKLLEKRRHTQSEMSSELKLSVPTIKEHLDALEKAELVKKSEEGYKWKYYALTEKAKCLLDPERKKVWILLSTFLAVITLGFLSVFTSGLFAKSMSKASSLSSTKIAESVSSSDVALKQVVSQPISAETYILFGFAIVAVMLIVLLAYYLAKSRIFKKY